MRKRHNSLLCGLLLPLVLLFACRAAQAIEFEPFSSQPFIGTVDGEVILGTPVDASGGTGVPWFEQRYVSKSASLAMQSGEIGNNASTTLVAKIEGRGRLSFWWKVSCEPEYDTLKFAIDGAVQETIYGEEDWAFREYTISGGGEHYLTWTYAKDVSKAEGSDAAWVDDILWEPFGGRQNLSLTRGWNWVSFQALSQSRTVGDTLGRWGFKANDVIQSDGDSARFTGYNWLKADFPLDFGKMYQIHVAAPVTVDIVGGASEQSAVRLEHGWNWVGNPTSIPVRASQLTHSNGWTANDRIQTSGGDTTTYTGSGWAPADFVLEPGVGYQIYSDKPGMLMFLPHGADDVLYAVVDLSGGPNASSYPVRYTKTPPNLNADTCRTTELWLRKIPAGTFLMGSPESEAGRYAGSEIRHEVRLTQDYYIGVFECTQKQWQLVMGSNPSAYKGDGRPVEQVSYNMIRGTGAEAGAGWPTSGHAVDATSFMGKLQAKTGLDFDLPTDAQWEYACRAGTTTALNLGRNLATGAQVSSMAEAGRCNSNQTDGKGGFSQHSKVGSYQPNAWGLYDMHGNVFEWCLDWLKDNLGPSVVSDPVGPNTGALRLVRGGSWNVGAVSCRSANRAGYEASSNGRDYCGFRVAIQPPQDSYAVVDLSGGPNALRYPVRYTNMPPDLNDDTCRTTELWLRKIPAGKFIMGSPSDEVGRNSDETEHEVTLTQDYYIGVFECTQRQWELVMGTKPSYFNNAAYYATRPVEKVSYDDIRGYSPTQGGGWPTYGHAADISSFMFRMRVLTGLAFDLPTEAQWEYACRAGTTTALNSGKNLTNENEDAAMSEVGRYFYNSFDGSGYSQTSTTANGTAKVGSYLPNAWGLYDMHGNVWEWCLDWYGARSTAAETDPVGPNTGSYRVGRGGSWINEAFDCRSANRWGYGDPQGISRDTGFRIAATRP